MGNQKKDVRELLLAINSASYPMGLEFKAIYEYRFKPNLMAITVDRKVIVFNGKMPIFQFRPKDDMEIILFLIEQMKKIENGEEIKCHKPITIFLCCWIIYKINCYSSQYSRRGKSIG